MNEPEWEMTVRTNGRGAVDADEVLKAVAVLLHPDQPHELRGLPSARSRTVNLNEPESIVAAAMEMNDDAGVYYTLNPVKPQLVNRAAKVSDITYRFNFLIDVDPVRGASGDVMATDAEKGDAWSLMGAVLDHLCQLGWPIPVTIDSGNGAHLIYRVDLPNNDLARVLCGKVLKVLAARFDNDRAKIDTKVHNASRIAKLPGTWVRKGPQTEDRPHRMSRLLWCPDTVEAVPVALIEALAGVGSDGEATEPKHPTASDPWEMIVSEGAPSDRVSAYCRSAMERELARVVLAGEGSRNDTLNRAAFAIGQFVGAGMIAESDAIFKLMEASRVIGLSEIEAERTIRSGLTSGKSQPRDLPASVNEDPKRKKPEEEVIDRTQRLIVLASEIKPRKVEWLWPDRIPLGKLTTFAGWGGLGKSFVTMDLAARVSRGDEIPGEKGQCFEQASVLIVNTEDDPDDTSVPRLMEAQAEMHKVAFARPEILGRLSLSDLNTFDVMLDQLGDCRLLIVDPATAHLGSVNDHKNAELRGLLMPLSLWAMRRMIAVILVTHVNKAGGNSGNVEAMARVVGSVAWVNAVRSAVMFARDQKDKERRLFLPFKSNNAPERNGLAYRIVATDTLAHVEWLGEVNTSADEAVNQPAKSIREKHRDSCETILRTILSGDVEIPSAEVVAKANKAQGHDKPIAFWRAIFERIGGVTRKSGFGAGSWVWRLPPGDD